MTVYVVTTRTGDGRKIKAVFEDRDEAICCCALFEADEAIMEAWDTDEIHVNCKKKPLAEWIVIIGADGRVIDMDVIYTFKEICRHSWDFDDSCTVRMTHDVDVSEGRAKEIALEYWRQLEKKPIE